MTFAIFTRLLWKEYRTYRAYALLLVLLVPLSAGFVRWEGGNNVSEHDVMQALLSAAVGVTFCFVLGAAGSCFAYERDHRTTQFLESIPVKDTWIALAKIVVVAGTTVLVTIVGTLLGRLVSGSIRPDNDWYPSMFNGGYLYSVAAIAPHVLLWGIFCSLYISQAHTAIILAATGYFAELVLWSVVGEFGHPYPRNPWYGSSQALLVVGLFDIVLLGLIVRRLPLWLNPARRAIKKVTSLPSFSGESFFRQARLLLWEQWRGTWLSQVCVAVAGFLILVPYARSVAAWQFVGALVGTTIFYDDQRRGQFRIFAEQGIDGRRIWWARQLRGFITLSIVTLAIISAYAIWLAIVPEPTGKWFTDKIRSFMTYPESPSILYVATLFVLAELVGYAIGQAFSFYCRSVIVALGIGLISSLALTVFLIGMQAICPKLIPVFALIVAPPLMLLTWAHAQSWNTELRWTKSLVMAGIAAVVLLISGIGAVACCRVLEIPKVVINPEDALVTVAATPEEQETARLYQELAAKFTDAPTEWLAPELSELQKTFGKSSGKGECQKWIAEHEELLDECQRMSDRHECRLSTEAEQIDAQNVFRWVVFRAHVFLGNGKLDEAIAATVAVMRMDSNMVGLKWSPEWAHTVSNIEYLFIEILQSNAGQNYRDLQSHSFAFVKGNLPLRKLSAEQVSRLSTAIHEWHDDHRVRNELLRQTSASLIKGANDPDVMTKYGSGLLSGFAGPTAWYSLMPGETARLRRILLCVAEHCRTMDTRAIERDLIPYSWAIVSSQVEFPSDLISVIGSTSYDCFRDSIVRGPLMTLSEAEEQSRETQHGPGAEPWRPLDPRVGSEGYVDEIEPALK
jgi:hypothetical protein